MTSRLLSDVPALAWPEFLGAFDWRQGEHVTLLGPTGTGKTTCAVQLLHRRAYVVAVGTKPKDSTFDYLRRHEGFRVVPKLPPVVNKPTRVIVWPKVRTLERTAKVAVADSIRHAMNAAYVAGGWCMFMDELSYLSNTLNLRPEMSDLWDQGRAMDVSIIGTSQRPRHIPLQAYSAATHLFLWHNPDGRDRDRLGELSGVDTDYVKRIVAALPKHHVLYVSTRTGAMSVTLAPQL